MAQNTYIVTIMGPGGVGKSSLTIRFVCGTFVKKYDPTIEDNYKKQLEIDGRAIMLDLMDTAGMLFPLLVFQDKRKFYFSYIWNFIRGIQVLNLKIISVIIL